MSTTTTGPSTRVVRRMMPRGWRYDWESRGGVTHPFTQVGVASPLVGGGVAGVGGGGTGEVVGVDTVGDTGGGDVGDGSFESPLVPHPATATAVAARRANKNLRVVTRAP